MSEVNELIAALEREQQYGGPIRRRTLNEERLLLITARNDRERTEAWEAALEEIEGHSNQAESQRSSLRKQIRDKGISDEELIDRIREARRVLAMYPREVAS